MKLLPIILVVLALTSPLVAFERCSLALLTSFTDSINLAPQPAALSTCTRYAGASCCKAELSDSIGAGTDSISAQISRVFVYDAESQCGSTVQQASCLQCASDQGVWTDSVSDSKFQFRVCQSFCDKLYADCGDNQLVADDSTVARKFADGRAMCLALFTSEAMNTYVVDGSVDKQCFDPNMPACTAANYESYYTPCQNGQRDLYYNWKDDNCAGGVKLPHNVKDVTCPIACESGQYLPLGTTDCTACPAGLTSSVKKCLTRWAQWPVDPEAPLSYRCANTYVDRDYLKYRPACQPWSLLGDRIESSIQGMDGITSVLQLYVNLVRPGWVSFVGTVNAENYYDRFYFRVDDVTKVILNNTVSRQQHNFSLPVGQHVLQWRYAKDDSLSYLDDKATIWAIEVGGTSWAADSCIPFGSDPCSCVGTENCDFATTPCTANDYHWEYKPCNAQQKTQKTYKWNEPKACSGGVSLPADEPLIECSAATCPYGMQKNFSNNIITCNICKPGTYALPGSGCDRCPTGQYSDVVNATTCIACGAGTTVNADRTDCIASCVFPVGEYGPLASINLNDSFWGTGPRILRQSLANGRSRLYQVSLCSKANSCYYNTLGQYTCDPPAYVFQNDDTLLVPRRIGVHFSYRRKSESEFSIVYTNSNELPFGCNSPNPTFTVDFTCIGENDTFSAGFTSSDPCHIVYSTRSALACRRCLSGDFEEAPRACENGMQVVDYKRKPGVACYDAGVELPTEPRACTTVEVSTSLAVVVALSVVIIFLALATAVFIVYRKKRHFEQEYQRLANNKTESDDIEL